MTRRLCRRVTTTALAALTLAVALAPAGQAAATFAGGFSAGPLNTGALDYFTFALAPGGHARERVRVANLRATGQSLELYAVLGVTSRASGDAYYGYPGGCLGAACWIRRLAPIIRLHGGTTTLVGFSVHVPPGTKPGQYLAGIAIQPAKTPPGARATPGSAATSVILRQIVVGVAVTVGSHLHSAVSIPLVKGEAIGATPGLGIVEENHGVRFEHPVGTATLVVGGHRRVFGVRSGTVLPGDHASLHVLTPHVAAGTYPARVELRYDELRKVAVWTGTVVIPAIQSARFVQGRGGTVIEETPPAAHTTTKTPTLLLVAIGAGLALLFVALGAVVRRAWVRWRRRGVAAG